MQKRAARPKRAVVALLALALTTGLVLAAGPASVSAGVSGKIDAKVLKGVQGGKATVYWAILRQKADLSGATAIKNWDARGWYVYNQLTSTAASSQKGLRALLKARGAPAKSFWIINAIRIRSGASTEGFPPPSSSIDSATISCAPSPAASIRSRPDRSS